MQFFVCHRIKNIVRSSQVARTIIRNKKERKKRNLFSDVSVEEGLLLTRRALLNFEFWKLVREKKEKDGKILRRFYIELWLTHSA